MSASGLGWLGIFPLLGGVIAALVLRRGAPTHTRRTAAYYLLLGSYGMVGLLTAQLAWALHKIESPRIDDPGFRWLGEGGGLLSYSVDAVSLLLVASAVVFGLGALLSWTRVGTRLEVRTLSLLAWGSIALGLTAFMASSRSIVGCAGAWAGLAFLRLAASRAEWDERPAIDREALLWELLSVTAFAFAASVLVFGARVVDVLLLRTASLEDLRAPLGALPLAECAGLGLTLALVCACVGMLGPAPGSEDSAPGGRANSQLGFVRIWMMTFLPWFVLCLRLGKLFALAPWAMAASSLGLAALAWWVVAQLAGRAGEGEDPETRLVAGLREGWVFAWLGGLVTLSCFSMGAVWGALLCLWTFGAASLLRSALMDEGAHEHQVPAMLAGLGVLGLGALALGELLFATLTHDSAGSPGLNYLLIGAWSVALFSLALCSGRAAAALPPVSRGTWVSWIVVTMALLAGTWPASLGGYLVPHESLGLSVIFGSFSESVVEFHVGPRADFVGDDGLPLVGPRAGTLALSVVCCLVGLRLGASRPSLLSALSGVARPLAELLASLRRVPWQLARASSTLSSWLAGQLGGILPQRVSEGATERTTGWRRRLGLSPERGLVDSDATLWAFLVLLLFGWLYFKPSVSTPWPNDFHSFGGLEPRLQRPADPSRERRGRAAAARNKALEEAGISTDPQLERIERPGALEPEVAPE